MSGPNTHLDIPPDALVVYVDEAGDPLYGNPSNPMFGLGGCAVLGREIEALIKAPWSSVRLAVCGGSTAQLHAAALEHRLTRRNEAVIRHYFDVAPVRRFAVISSNATKYDRLEGLSDPVVQTTAHAMLRRIEDLAQWTPCNSLIFIFEDNTHLIPRLEAALAGVRATVANAGVAIPISWCHMPKTIGDPGLEVADFIIHTASGYCRSGRDPQGKFAARFSSMFGPVDQRLVSFIEMSSVSYDPTSVSTGRADRL